MLGTREGSQLDRPHPVLPNMPEQRLSDLWPTFLLMMSGTSGEFFRDGLSDAGCSHTVRQLPAHGASRTSDGHDRLPDALTAR